MAEITALAQVEAPLSQSVFDIPRTTEKLPGTTIDFLYVSHGPAHSNDVAKRLKDADLILFEITGGPKEQRKKLEELFNDILGVGSHEEGVDKAFAAKLDQNNSLDWIIFKLAGTGKKIKFIDAPADTSELRATDEGWKVGDEVSHLIKEGKILFTLPVDYMQRDLELMDKIISTLKELK